MLRRGNRTALVLLMTALFVVFSFLDPTGSIRPLLFVGWLSLVSWEVGFWFQKDRPFRWLYGVFGVSSVLVISWVLLARFYVLTQWTSLLPVLLLVLAIELYGERRPFHWSFSGVSVALPTSYASIAFLTFCFTWMFTTLRHAQTFEALSSPWQVLPRSFFVVYGLAGLVSLWFVLKKSSFWSWLSIFAFFGVSFSVAAIVYGFGFGFDPFIHRAAETALVHNGFIEPRQILYLGQYALISGLNLLTGIPVLFIDRWLVPFVATFAIPSVSYLGLRHGFTLNHRSSVLALFALLGIPFSVFIFTVPFNLSTLLFVVVTLLVGVRGGKRHNAFLWLLSLTAFLFHPIGGAAAAALLVAKFFLQDRRDSSLVSVLLAVSVVALLIPSMFFLHGLLGGGTKLVFGQSVWVTLLELFGDPYAQTRGVAPQVLEYAYAWIRWMPIAVVLLALSFYKGGVKQVSERLLLCVGVGLGCSMLFLAQFFRFDGVIAYEQLEYAIRLRQLFFFVFLLTFLILVLQRFKKSLSLRWTQYLAIPLLMIVTMSFYMSYPQVNEKTTGVGASVGEVDVEAVRFIEGKSEGLSYVALAHQMTSAAALQEFGFLRTVSGDQGEMLWYPLPTGGWLYEQFQYMSTNGPDQELVEEVLRVTQVEKLYFFTYDNWPEAGRIRAQAASFAQASYGVQGTRVVIYEYQ